MYGVKRNERRIDNGPDAFSRLALSVHQNHMQPTDGKPACQSRVSGVSRHTKPENRYALEISWLSLVAPPHQKGRLVGIHSEEPL